MDMHMAPGQLTLGSCSSWLCDFSGVLDIHTYAHIDIDTYVSVHLSI